MPEKNYSDDDGYTVADMSGIEMPHLFSINPAFFDSKKTKKNFDKRKVLPIESELSVWKMTLLVWRLIMPLIFLFLLGTAIFILFCQFIWLK